MTAEAVVRAAGGVVWRPDGRGGVELLVVHRPRRSDWTFAKGKAEPGEDDVACALREVAEETGHDCRLGPELGRVHYRDHRDRPKVVRWWAMTVLSGSFRPNDEVDEVVWLAPTEAMTLLVTLTLRLPPTLWVSLLPMDSTVLLTTSTVMSFDALNIISSLPLVSSMRNSFELPPPGVVAVCMDPRALPAGRA